MKGVVFNLLETVVTEAHGAETWDDLLDAAGASGAYTSLGNYCDAELESLVTCAAQALSLSRDEVLRWFGANAIPVLAELYPDLFTAHASARPSSAESTTSSTWRCASSTPARPARTSASEKRRTAGCR